jgi:hypothetical protein
MGQRRLGRVGGPPGGITGLVEEPARFGLLELERWIGRREPTTAVLGALDDGRPVIVDFRRISHLLIEAPEGWGKSTLVRTALVSACWSTPPSQLGVLAIDLSERELCVAEALPHAWGNLTREVTQASEVVAWTAEEARRRRESALPGPAMLLVIDDADWLCDPDQEPARNNLRRLLEDGDTSGVHVIGAADRGVWDHLVGRRLGRSALSVRAAPPSRSGSGTPRGTFVALASNSSQRFHSACLSASDLNTAARVLVGARELEGPLAYRGLAEGLWRADRGPRQPALEVAEAAQPEVLR